MYYAYVVLYWRPEESSQGSTATRIIETVRKSEPAWVCDLKQSGCVAFSLPAPTSVLATHVLAGDTGLVYGRVFDRKQSDPVSPNNLPTEPAFAQACLATDGGHLVDNYWGSYVAFLFDRTADQFRVIRDCSGMLSCFYTEISGVHIFFSDIRHVLPLLKGHLINWKYIAAFLAFPSIQIRETGLENVFELMAGESVLLSAAGLKHHFSWDPIALAATNTIPSRADATRAFREATEYCIRSWAASFNSVLHSLSGGFDSSVVLGYLSAAQNRPKVLCVNRFSQAPGEDERRYARLVARAHHTQLIEFPWSRNQSSYDMISLRYPLSLKPTIPLLAETLDAPFWNRIGVEARAEAIWTGQGGDHIFMSAKTTLGVADCIRRQGVGRTLLRTIHEASVLTRHSVWDVIGSALAAMRSEKGFLVAAGQLPQTNPLASGLLADDLERYMLHPWVKNSRCLPPGKRYQITLFAELLNRHRPLPGIRTIEEFHPLLSQPLLETALRIPLHLLLDRGRVRGLARSAFVDLVPSEILHRELKGRSSSYHLALLRKSIRFVSDTLLNGLLVKEGLLSRSRVEKILANDEPVRSDTFFPILACLAAELWTRSWESWLSIRATASDVPMASPLSLSETGSDTHFVAESKDRLPSAPSQLRSAGLRD